MEGACQWIRAGVSGFGRTGAVVGRFLRANGVRPTILDIDSEKVEVLRRVGIKVFYGDASRHDLLESAGAGSAKLLVVAIDDAEKTVELVNTVQKHFPHLKVLARAGGRRQHSRCNSIRRPPPEYRKAGHVENL